MNKFVIIFISILMIAVGFAVQRAIVDRNPQVVSSTEAGNEEILVLADKVWKIEFTKEMDKATINPENVYVTNSNGDRLHLKLELSDNKKMLVIYPPDGGYDPKMKSYTLHVESDIKATNGHAIKSDKQIQFTVTKDLPVIKSKEQLASYFKRIIKSQNEMARKFKYDGAVEESANTASDSAGAEKSSSGANEFTDTNVQVQGVDEADIVKTDGSYIYQAIDEKLKITKVVPSSNIDTVATIPFKGFQPFQLFVDDNKLVVMGHSYSEFEEPASPSSGTADKMIMPMHQQTKILVFDVTDKGHPKEIKSIELEGNYVTSRKIGSKVYVINNHYPDYWIMEHRKDVDLRPRYRDSASSDEPKYVDFKKIRYLPESKEANFSMIASFDINEPGKEANVSTYLGSGQEIYMTKENLYITVTRYEYQDNEREIHTPIEDTDIYKFGIKDLQVEFVATGTVPGRLLNQFSMDEHEGYFRIATTRGNSWDENKPSANNLYVLDSKLQLAGSVEDLARGERIYSVRFMGNKAYIVTFKETDPLFVLDVSDPTKPTVLGELKIPGFSNYLHPYDENHLIGFGQNTKVINDKGASQPRIMTDGVKISLFDVTDPLNPKEKFTEIIGGSGTYSPLNHDHKALLFNMKKNIFAFPVTIYEDKPGSQYEQIFKFQGAYAYKIDLENGFQLKQKITHEHNGVQYENWENQIMRVINIGDELFAISPKKITAHEWE